MTAKKGPRSWEHVLRQTRTYHRDRSRLAQCHDLRTYYRATAYRTYDGLPEPVVRAQAFARVLDCVPLHCYRGEAFAGSVAGFRTPSLPAGISDQDYRAAVHEEQARGSRSFIAGRDHTLADYPTLLQDGIGGVQDHARRELERRCGKAEQSALLREHLERFTVAGTDLHWVRVRPDDTTAKEIALLRAVCVCLEALGRFAHRYATACRSAGNETAAEALERVSDRPPRTLWEAMQLVWLVHIAFCSEGRHAMALGRVDQYLLPFYRRDVDAGRIDQGEALSLFCHLWAHVEELGEVTNICIGGLTPEGADATNELSYMALQATRLVASPHTNLSARFHDGTPQCFHEACFETIRTGIGFPALFNDHVLVPGLTEIDSSPPTRRTAFPGPATSTTAAPDTNECTACALWVWQHSRIRWRRSGTWSSKRTRWATMS